MTDFLLELLSEEIPARMQARARGDLGRMFAEEMEKAGRIEGFIGRYSWALCSFLFVLIIGAGMFNRFMGKPSLGASEVPNMAANLAPYLFSPRSQSRSDVVEFENRAVGGAPVRIPTASVGKNVVVVRGGSVTIDGRHYLRIDMLDSGRPVTLYAIEGANVVGVEPMPGRERLAQGVINGRNCVAWADGEYSVMLVGKEPVSDLAELADMVSGR